MVSQNELRKALSLLAADWHRQNDHYDKRSNFIYQVQTVEECLQKAQEMGIDENYVLHRWYNFHTSTYCESLFVKCGAQKESQVYNHDVDIYINGIPYDVKLTVYPAKLKREGVFWDLKKREGKNALIRWMYANQSQEGRKHLKNRMFIVCNAWNEQENMALKSAFDVIEQKIRNYFGFLQSYPPNKLVIYDDDKEYTVYSEVICIEG